MSLAEEMLASISVDDGIQTYSEIEEHIVVNDMRQIIVPNSLKTIAVTGDKDIETLTLDCVRYWEGNDLSTFSIYLNYVLPDQTPGTYIPDIISTNEGEKVFHFDWQIKNNITAKSGKISFAITAIKTKQNDEGETVIDKQWSSIPNTDCSIALGLDISNVPTEEESPDVIAQLSQILEDIQSNFSNWVKTVIVQTGGSSTQKVMSQRATTNNFKSISDLLGQDISFEDGKCYYSNLEEVINTANYSLTNYIKVKPNSKIVVSSYCNEYFPVVFFEGEKRVGSEVLAEGKGFEEGLYTKEIDIPYNCNHIRFSAKTEHKWDSEVIFPNIVKEELKDIGNTFANTLKGKVSGATVSMDDVSPIPHKIPVKTSGKNLFDISKVTNTSAITNNGDGSLTVTVYYSSTHKRFRELCPHVKVGDTVTMSANTTGANFVYFSITGETIYYKTPFVVTQDRFDSDIAFYGSADKTAIIRDIQVELDTVATEYTPYVADDTEITVKSCGKNLINIPDTTVSGTGAWTSQKLGDFLLPNGTYRLSCKYEQTGNLSTISMSVRKYNTNEQFVSAYSQDASGTMSILVTITDDCNGGITLYTYSNENANALTTSCDFKDIQLEKGTVSTEYEPYIEGETITTTIAEGAELNSIAPNMTITTDIDGVTIDAEYNKDTNKVIEKLTQAIISLGGNI